MLQRLVPASRRSAANASLIRQLTKQSWIIDVIVRIHAREWSVGGHFPTWILHYNWRPLLCRTFCTCTYTTHSPSSQIKHNTLPTTFYLFLILLSTIISSHLTVIYFCP